jgi:TAG lipase/steryl ester hydrolase/phospholipase A2/LPA acyltransferase
MNHIGVVKTLWQHKLLPRIISGSSAGSIVCAVLCTKTDAEIPEVLHDFCHGDLAVFEKEDAEENVLQKAARFLKYGAIFDISNLTRVLQNLLGDLTFQEAYNRTRRILNISVSSASIHELPRLLNHITAPNVIIWSAVAASCSVPVIFLPASLLAKDPKSGEFVPWNPSPQRWIDGSVDNDLPMTRLAEMFNVNHFIVSQVNPHVVPFLVKEDDVIASAAKQSSSAFTPGPDWLHKMASLAKGEALHRMHVLAEMGVFPNGFTKLRSVLSQKYSGDITILPEISYANFPKVLKNPTPEFMEQAMLSGERATWPKLSRIQNHCAIELALDDTVQQLRSRIAFSPSQVDLRLGSLTMSSAKRGGVERRGRSRKSDRARHRHSGSLEPESSTSPPKRPASYFEVRPKEPLTAPLQNKNHTSLKLPGSPAMKVAAVDLLSSSAEDEQVDLNPFSEDTDDSSLSYSDDSPPDELSRPTLWPSTRQLFPSATAPTTPFLTSRLSRSSTITQHPQTPAALAMTPKPNATPTTSTRNSPSSPELRYKQLFQGYAPISNTDGTSEVSPQKRRRSVVEFSQVYDDDDYDDDDDEWTRSSGRPGSSTPLVLDISGTRGMMLRRKRSLSTGLKGVTPPAPR